MKNEQFHFQNSCIHQKKTEFFNTIEEEKITEDVHTNRRKDEAVCEHATISNDYQLINRYEIYIMANRSTCDWPDALLLLVYDDQKIGGNDFQTKVQLSTPNYHRCEIWRKISSQVSENLFLKMIFPSFHSFDSYNFQYDDLIPAASILYV